MEKWKKKTNAKVNVKTLYLSKEILEAGAQPSYQAIASTGSFCELQSSAMTENGSKAKAASSNGTKK